MTRLIDAEALKSLIIERGFHSAIETNIFNLIDLAPTVTVLKDERPKVCFNCEHCCVLELKNNGEILIKCNLGNGQKCGADMRKENNI